MGWTICHKTTKTSRFSLSRYYATLSVALHCGIVFYILDAIIPFNLIQLVYAAACSLQSKLQKSNALCFDLFYAPQYDIDVCNVYRTELKVK